MPCASMVPPRRQNGTSAPSLSPISHSSSSVRPAVCNALSARSTAAASVEPPARPLPQPECAFRCESRRFRAVRRSPCRTAPPHGTPDCARRSAERQATAQHDAMRLFSPWMVVTRTVSCSAIDCMTISTRGGPFLPPSGDVERQVDLCTGTNSRIRVYFLFSSKSMLFQPPTFISSAICTGLRSRNTVTWVKPASRCILHAVVLRRAPRCPACANPELIEMRSPPMRLYLVQNILRWTDLFASPRYRQHSASSA